MANQPALLDQPPISSTKEMQLVPVPPAGSEASLVLMFERLATNPAVDVEKLARLIEMQERILAHEAKAAFDTAFAAMQPHIPEIDEKGRIVVEGTVRSTYAKNEDIQKAIKPILAAHGFSLGFETRWPAENKTMVEVVATLGHTGGHSRTSMFRAEADKTGSKNGIQALGSSTSYGRRYTTIDLLNISTREPGHGADDDGRDSEKHTAPAAPDGYDAFIANMATLAERGTKPMYEAWNKAPAALRQHATKNDRDRWESLKATAAKVGSGAS